MLNGVVLHRRPYRETSVIVDFFTLEQGRVSAVVRGMRQAKSDRKSLLQPFQSLQLQLAGKSELKTLAHVEANDKRISLTGDALYCGFYINELLTRVLPQGLVADTLYHRYIHCLDQLVTRTALDISLRHFEFGVLDELGVLPDITVTSEGEPLSLGNRYCFHTDIGIVPIDKGKNTFLGQSLIDIANEEWNDESRATAKLICRQALHPFLGSKPLHSRALFKRA
ncbi:DNA repair protein RecO [Alteromonas sp. 5E99-2]|uniref:DNA repair protein RecO n=1 Tax=Alteromonas sp. 5E99-2 TaxID=2817683 RepID=UPI001A98D29D|nr:DNA repair protein RecO [Alteromonas sp. 5E99-2]MBO1254317.1 DNA repair protein RecO [Alteromonas sp. 5E99-2]